MKKTFGQRLREKMGESGIKPAELSRRSGVTKQNIDRLLNATPHPITGALPTTTRETVEKLAPALDWDLNDALLAAGLAPNAPTDDELVADGLFSGYYDLSPEQQRLARKQIAAIIRSFKDEDFED